MKRKIKTAIILTIGFIFISNSQTWPNYTEVFGQSVLTESSGAGTYTFNIGGNTLSLQGHGFFDSTVIFPKNIVKLGVAYDIPDMVLGYVEHNNNTGQHYSIEILDNWLKINMINWQTVSDAAFDFTVTLPPFTQNYQPPPTVTPDENQNYILHMTSESEYASVLYSFSGGVPHTFPLKGKVNASVTYLDGLGRPIQGNSVAASPMGYDIIQPYEYDNIGRTDKQYLGYPSDLQNDGNFEPSDLSQLETYYISNYSDDFETGTPPNAYSETDFEESPLNRPLKSGAPGHDWRIVDGLDSDHSIKHGYGLNSVDIYHMNKDNVIRFDVSFPDPNDTESPELISGVGGYYPENELVKSIIKDENWQPIQTYRKDNTIEEFRDKMGDVVLKRSFESGEPHDTYYVYDDYGNLTYVIPPLASYNIVDLVPTNMSGISNRVNYSWVDLVQVDREFAEDYNKKLSEYKNDEIRKADIANEFGGQGGFALLAHKDGTFSVEIDFSTTTPVDLKNGIIASFHRDFNMRDADMGWITQNGVNYRVSIRGNDVIVSGSGSLNSLDQELFTSPPQTAVGTINESALEGLCYIYHYDRRNRLIEKKIPGKSWEYIVYNKMNLPVLSQDGNLRVDDKWMFTKYDIFGRSVYSGLYGYTPQSSEENAGRIELAEDVDSQTSDHYETRNNSSLTSIDNMLLVYSNDSYPSSNLELLTVNYYDNYSYPSNGVNYTGYSFGQTISSPPKMLPIGSSVRILDTNDWIHSRTYYDIEKRPIFIRTKNQFLDSEEIVKNHFDYGGRLLETETTKIKGTSAPIIIFDKFTYDYTGRLMTQVQSIDNQPDELIVNNEYDEIGQLKSEKVGGEVALNPTQSNGLQTIDYEYNVRGWLKSINEGTTSGSDLFGFKLNYNNTTLGATDVPALFNGNISEVHWKTKSDNNLRSYAYGYDAMNRLKKADYFGNHVLNSNSQEIEDYSVFGINYDKNGNIKTLHRYGFVEANNTIDVIDMLSYNYAVFSNQLLGVRDYAHDDGFKGVFDQTGDYTYDANGNMTSDNNKKINNISYNHLNLPSVISIGASPQGPGDDPNAEPYGTIYYKYDALGNKLKKSVNSIYLYSNSTSHTDYDGGFLYRYESDNAGVDPPKLSLIFNQKGYFDVPFGGIQNGNYNFQYLDHLGNVRLTYSDSNGNGIINASTEILEENNYYPFGLEHKGYNNNISANSNSVASKFKYNGVELEETLGLDLYEMNFRMYDPAIGRFNGIDPVTHFSQGTSVAFDNNPIFWADPSGADSFNGENLGADGVTNSQWMELSRPDGGGSDALRNQAMANYAYLGEQSKNASVKSGELSQGGIEGIKFSYQGSSPEIIDWLNASNSQLVSGLLMWAVYINAGNGSHLSDIFVSPEIDNFLKGSVRMGLGETQIKRRTVVNTYNDKVEVGFNSGFWNGNNFSNHKINYVSLYDTYTTQDRITFLSAPYKSSPGSKYTNQDTILWIKQISGGLLFSIRQNLEKLLRPSSFKNRDTSPLNIKN